MNQVRIPNGDEKVTVELTVKELLALTGVRFRENHMIEVEARKKLKETLEETYDLEPKRSPLVN